MNTNTRPRPKTSRQPRTPSRSGADGLPLIVQATQSEFGIISSPQTSTDLPPQTPSHSLSGRTKDSLRLAMERRQSESARKHHTPKPTSNKTRSALTFTPSVSRPRISAQSVFNPSRSRPTTPISSIGGFSSTPSSPHGIRQGSKSTFTSSPKVTPMTLRTSAGSSVAVRDAIKKAKEAHKQKIQKTPQTPWKRIDYTDETSFDDFDNPFNAGPGTPPLQAHLRRAIEYGRTSGNLNISNLELQEVPEDVHSMYNLTSKSVVIDFSSKSSGWYESVDLERFNASGNEIPHLDERIVEEFGGLKHFDMHANILTSLPTNFASLSFLRTLNLSKNRLTLGVLKTVVQISTLIELYLAHNDIQGPLPPEFATLKNLQIVDLEANRITSLPDDIREIRRMRILILAENQLEDLPWKALESLDDLHQLDISSNRFRGELLPHSSDQITLRHVSSFDVHSNGLTSLPSALHLPSLTQFNATQNSISSTGTFFTNTRRLVHLSLGQNQLPTLPGGIIHLPHLRTLDISNNIIEHIDPRLGLLDELTTLMWMGNLIRMRAWGSMDTEGIKSALRAKLDEATLEGIEGDLGNVNISKCKGECGGTLNLTGKVEEHPLTKETFTEHIHPSHFPVLSKITLQQNRLIVAPMEISLVTTLTTLDLSKNYLSSRLFKQPITLEQVSHLDLSVNKIDTLEYLPTIISAPNLKILDISFNSLTSLVPLHTHYPNLLILHANSNQLTSLSTEDLQGLEIVQVNNNSISKLPPELGLLESLRILGVDGNTFRVPGRRIVDAGSAALLEWLRGRCIISH